MGLNSKICYIFFFMLSSLAIQAQTVSKELRKIRLEGPAQGTQFHVTYFASDSVVKRQEIDSILKVIDLSMSVYHKDSKISLFNQDTATHIEMDKHMAHVIAASFRYNKLSSGQFDITIAPLVNLWGFGVKRSEVVPDSATVYQAKKFVGMHYLKVKGSRLIKKKPGVKIDVNGIAQGYTVDVLADYLKHKGLSSYMVEVGGEISVSGAPPEQQGFSIGILHPDESKQGEIITAIVQLRSGALTTAGSFEKFIQYKNKKMGHHINPLTGFPYTTRVLSVSVYARTAMDADALDNYFMGMDPAEIIAKAKTLKGIEVFVIYHDKKQTIQTIYSDGFGKLFKN